MDPLNSMIQQEYVALLEVTLLLPTVTMIAYRYLTAKGDFFALLEVKAMKIINFRVHLMCVQEDANRMIITDSNNNRLSVWSVDGCQPILTVPVKSSPRGICKYPHTHRIVVSCSGSNDIKVFDCKTKNEWNVIQQFGSQGSQPGQFNNPFGVCIDDRGVLIVVDWSNYRVQLF